MPVDETERSVREVKPVTRMVRRIRDQFAVCVEPEQSDRGVLVFQASGKKRNVRDEIFVIDDPIASLLACGGGDAIAECFVAHPWAAERVQTCMRIAKVREREGRKRRAQTVPGDANVLLRMVLTICSDEPADLPPDGEKIAMKSLMHARSGIVDE